ncbi:MAG: TonB-dependent receptor domain-containing protein [Gemmatimonadaceae bacterium]
MTVDRIGVLRVRHAALALAGFFPFVSIAAQSTPASTGRIVGRVIDGTSGQGLPDVGVQVVGTTLGAMTGVDGRYALTAVPAGTVTIQVRRLGFQPKTVTGILLAADRTLEQNITMESATITLAAQVVTASAERGSVNEALDAQRVATGVVSAITTEQIARSPDSDAAQAVQRVSGVTVTGGRYVFVRGLGERYTTAQLNGTRIPSPEPEKRVVPLDLFPSGLLQTITTQKTFTPDLQGDFSGAQVDIRTREFPARRTMTYAITVGANGSAVGSDVQRAFTVGGERLALVSNNRSLPPLLKAYSDQGFPSLNDGDKRLLISSFRNAWSPGLESGAPNASTSISVGGNDPIFGQRVGYLVSGTYSTTQEVRTDQQRALAYRGYQPGQTMEIDHFEGETGSQSFLWGGILNLSTLLGGHTRILVNNTFNRTADNEARSERGDFESEGTDVKIDRNQYVERSVRSNQLGAEHQLGEHHRADWFFTSSAVTRNEPDRSEFISIIEPNNGGSEVLRWRSTGNGGAVRTFGDLHESSNEARANYQYSFTQGGRQHAFKIGGLYRATERDASTFSYSISAPNATQTERELRPEQIFDGRFANRPNFWELVALSQGGNYDAKDRLSAGFGMVELALSDRLRFIGGARYESDDITLNARSTLGAPVHVNHTWNDVMPSAAFNLKVSEFQTLRLSLSRTIARPEYRELSPVASRDVLNADDVQGNPDLLRTRIVNADVRWEWYPTESEVFSIGLFGKRFDDPIERAYRAGSSANRTIVYVNADAATNYGVELELRKSLGFLARPLQSLVAFSNVTMMRSEINLGEQQLAATNADRRMVGQAPYVVNAGLTYTSTGGSTSATVLLNRTGERIDAAGDQPLPDVILQPRSVLDVSLRFPLLGAVNGRFDARNLLDSPYESIQGTVTREFYRQGRVFQLGFQWRP